MIKNKKKVLITSLVILEIISLFLVYKAFPKNETILEDVKLRENITKNSSFALMIQQEDGTYKESTSSKWPTEMEYNEELSGCMDANGNKLENVLSYNDSTNSVKLKINGAIYCYVYFDQSSGESIIVNVSTDGTKNTLPSYNKYKQELTCKGADAYFNTKYQRIEISQVSKKSTTCTLNYTSDTSSYLLLNDKLKSVGEEITSTNNAGGTDISYRYTGKQPENYVWFNNELWRIIGLIPVCLESGCGTPTTSLIKIIRAETIGSLVYDISGVTSSIKWNESAVYEILNNYYYGKKDGTNTEYCSTAGNCDYTVHGISSDSSDYYGRMVKEVYWNTSNCRYTQTSDECYKNETTTQSISGKVGLMNGSDYGYSRGDSGVDLKDYAAGYVWLYSNWDEWIMNYDTSGDLLSTYDGGLTGSNDNVGNLIRPVVYLDENIYIISGSGTAADPFILGM